MTKDELLSYRSLLVEVRELRKELCDLEERHKCDGGMIEFAEMVYLRRKSLLEEAESRALKMLTQLEHVIAAMPSTEGRLLRMRYVQGWSWAKVADSLGYSVDHCKGFLHKKAMGLLKKVNTS